jgi:acrylyl-CoA reductase (NADPH)
MKLEQLGVLPRSGDILVTGASGGVGSVAIAILAKLGYRVVASTGRSGETDYCKSLGAGRGAGPQGPGEPGKPLQKERWARRGGFRRQPYARQCVRADEGRRRRDGVRARAGHGPSVDRGAVHPARRDARGHQQRDGPAAAPRARVDALAKDLDRKLLASMTEETNLEGRASPRPKILAGQVRGRLVVDVNR